MLNVRVQLDFLLPSTGYDQDFHCKPMKNYNVVLLKMTLIVWFDWMIVVNIPDRKCSTCLDNLLDIRILLDFCTFFSLSLSIYSLSLDKEIDGSIYLFMSLTMS